MQRVVVLMAAHNRSAQTIECLTRLFAGDSEGLDLRVILVDDGSTDNTRFEVSSRYPQVRIVEGDGSLFWNRGMALAWREATDLDYDFVLWLNDDVALFEGALQSLYRTWCRVSNGGQIPCIVAGSLKDPTTYEWSYGVARRTSKWHPTRGEVIHPDPEVPVQAESFHGNVVLIPRTVEAIVGVLDPFFSHGMGDTDYARRAHRAGIQIWTPSGFVGTCPSNPDAVRTLRQRASRKYAPPRDWWYFVRRHAPWWAWPFAFLSPYAGAMRKKSPQGE